MVRPELVLGLVVGVGDVASGVDGDRRRPGAELVERAVEEIDVRREPFRRTADAGHRLWYNLVADGGLSALITGPDRL